MYRPITTVTQQEIKAFQHYTKVLFMQSVLADNVAKWNKQWKKDNTMTATIVVDLTKGLLASEHGIRPPFCVVLPCTSNLNEQYHDGHDNGRSLEEILLTLPNVKKVRVGQGMGLLLEHYTKENV